MISADSYPLEPFTASFNYSKEVTSKWTSIHGYQFTEPEWITETELTFDYEASVVVVREVYGNRLWMLNVVYLLLVFGGQRAMAKRPPLRVTRLLKFWNLSLAIFSIIGAARTLPETIATVRGHGFYPTVCIIAVLFNNKVTAFWTLMFTISKAVEFGDTFFLVARKRPVIFLHWYHHMIVTFFAYYCFVNAVAVGRWFMVINYCVHAIMYSYFFIRSIGVWLPKPLSMAVTSLQILQMVICTAMVPLGWYYKQQGRPCGLSATEAAWFSGIYLSFFVLFGKFFLDAYLRPKNKKKSRVD